MKKLKFRPEEKREPRILTKIILTLPALLSATWLASIIYRVKNPVITAEGVLLSPPVDSKMLIVALSILTAGYVVFLLMMFSSDIREFFVKQRIKVRD